MQLRVMAWNLVIAGLCAVAPPSMAADAPAPPAEAASRIDRAHDWLYLRMQDWATRLDQRFVHEDETPEPTPPTPFRISLDLQAIDRPGTVEYDASLDVDLLLQLPNLEKRLKIFLTSDEVDEAPTLSDEQRRVRAGARLTLRDYLSFDLGVRLDLPPVAFTALRWQRQLVAGGWDVEPFAKVYLESGDGLGAAAGVTFDYWHNRWLTRSASYVNWQHEKDATEWTQSVLLANAREILRFGRYGSIVRGSDLVRAVGVQALASGERTSRTDTYELSFFVKQPTGRNWLYWHVTPLVRWEREYGWHPDYGIRAGIDVLFWDLSGR